MRLWLSDLSDGRDTGEKGEAALREGNVWSYLEPEVRGRGIDQKHTFAHSWLSLQSSVEEEATATLPHTDASSGGQNLDFSSKSLDVLPSCATASLLT